MHTTTFEDSIGRQWNLALNLNNLDVIRQQLRIDLNKIRDGRELIELQADIAKLGAIAWAICEPSAKEQGVDRKSFLEALDGAALDRVADALVEAVIQVAPKKSRDALRKVITSTFEAHREAMAKIENWVEANAGKLLEEVSAVTTAKLNGLLTAEAK